VIYESSSYANDWNGEINGKEASEGTYFYTLKRADGEEYTGVVTVLIRK